MAPFTSTAKTSANAEVGAIKSPGTKAVPLTITRIVKVLLNVCVTLKMIVANNLGAVVCRIIPQTARYCALFTVSEVLWQRCGIVPKVLIDTSAIAGKTTMNRIRAEDKTLNLALLNKEWINGIIIAKLTKLHIMDGTLISSLTIGRRTPPLDPGETLATNKVVVMVKGAVKVVETKAIKNEFVTTGKVLIKGALLLVMALGP